MLISSGRYSYRASVLETGMEFYLSGDTTPRVVEKVHRKRGIFDGTSWHRNSTPVETTFRITPFWQEGRRKGAVCIVTLKDRVAHGHDGRWVAVTWVSPDGGGFSSEDGMMYSKYQEVRIKKLCKPPELYKQKQRYEPRDRGMSVLKGWR